MTEKHWSEWKTHTPGPCPVRRGAELLVHVEYSNGSQDIEEGRANTGAPVWRATYPGEYVDGARCPLVIRYRVRQYPDALEQLRQLAEDPHKMVEVLA